MIETGDFGGFSPLWGREGVNFTIPHKDPLGMISKEYDFFS